MRSIHWRNHWRLGLMLALAAAPAAFAKPWIMKHGQSAAQYQAYYDNELPPGYRPISVNMNGPTSDPRFTTVFIADGVADGDWAARHGQDSAEYQTEVDTLNAQGFRVISVDATGDYPNERYVSAFVRDGVPDSDWGARHRMTAADLLTEESNFQAAGFRMIWLSGYGSGANRRFAAAWVKNYEGWTCTPAIDYDAAGYQELVIDNYGAGMRPVCVTAYGDPNAPLFGAIFLRPDGDNWDIQPDWFARHGQTGVEYQQTVDDEVNTPFQSLCAVEYGQPSDPRYASTWFSDRGPVLWSVQGKAVAQLSSLDAAMQTFMTDHKIAHGSLAVTKDKRLVYSRAFTNAPKDEPPTTLKSRFRIASVSKPITATAIMMLIEDGRLSLDDTLSKWRQFDASNWCDSRIGTITIRNLLQHAAGWDRSYDPNNGDAPFTVKCAGQGAPKNVNHFDAQFMDFSIDDEFGIGLPVTEWDIINYMKLYQLDFDPGTNYEYSNFGYNILGRVIEIVTGTPYEKWVHDNVLCPVGAPGMQMGGTLLSDKLPNEVHYRDPMNRGRTSRIDGETIVPAPYGGWNQTNMGSHGGWIATAEEMARFVCQFTDKNTHMLLSDDSIDDMWAASPNSGGYGMGWQISGSNRYHNGSLPGAWAFICRRPDGVTFSVLLSQKPSDEISPISDQGFDIYNSLNSALDAVTTYPTTNLFGFMKETCAARLANTP